MILWGRSFAVAALVAIASAAPRLAARASVAEERVAPGAAGPVRREIPTNAVVAEDEGDLARLLKDPHGATEIWLRGREYHGDYVIERPMTIHGELGATIVGTGAGTVVTLGAPGAALDNVVVRHSGRRNTTEDAGVRATAPDAVVSHVRVEDTLFGISLGPCARCRVDHAWVRGDQRDMELRGDGIKLWESSDSVVEDSVVEDSRDVVVWYSRRVRLARNTITRSRYGSHFMYSHDSVVRDSRLVNNVVGIFVMYSSRVHAERNVLAGARGAAGMGVGFKESDGVSLKDNWFVANNTGTYLDQTPRSKDAPVRFDHNVFALNETALRLHSSESGLFFSDNEFQSNGAAVEVEGGGDALGVTFHRNYWSDYEGYDLNHDGFGDVPHEVQRLSSDLLEEYPSLRLFTGTATMSLIDTIARAAPVFASQKMLSDDQPRIDHRSFSP
ncbi:MAG TPA: nitrous oxide reductase family maturation protein NosD [Polyangiaceae bacterium]|nr:nitrous oxide reductase family maturation protein NosD [Polyangiaceae bacterium]